MVYKLLHALIGAVFQLVFRWRISGVENIPKEGYILASNHLSNWDPLLVGCALPVDRKVHFMAKEELFAFAAFRKLILWLGAFPVRRGAADRNAIKTALKLLADGEIVGIFPEGHRSKTGELGQAAPGMALIAVKAGAPVLPTAIVGTNKLFRDGNLLPRFEVRFGRPVTVPTGFSDKDAAQYINTAVMQEIASLRQTKEG